MTDDDELELLSLSTGFAHAANDCNTIVAISNFNKVFLIFFMSKTIPFCERHQQGMKRGCRSLWI